MSRPNPQSQGQVEAKRCDAIQVGDWIDREPYYGEIAGIANLGRGVGDGTVDWIVFRVRQPSNHAAGLRSFSDSMGPMKADDTLTVISPPDPANGHPYPAEFVDA